MDILKLKMKCDDLPKVKTVGDYLAALLSQVLIEGESFSGKRPFGNSGWEGDLYIPLIKNKIIEGEVRDGCIEDMDAANEAKADKLILEAIKKAFKG